MSRCSLPVIANQPLGDTAGFAGGLTISVPALDPNQKQSVHKCGRILHGNQSSASTNVRTGANGGWKADSIETVVDAHRQSRADVDRLLQEVAHQRQCEKTVSDRSSERRFGFGLFGVEMNPLSVLGGVSEFLNAILRYDKPVGCREFASSKLCQTIQVLNLKRRHRSIS
jgi:hypothetical protein